MFNIYTVIAERVLKKDTSVMTCSELYYHLPPPPLCLGLTSVRCSVIIGYVLVQWCKEMDSKVGSNTETLAGDRCVVVRVYIFSPIPLIVPTYIHYEC